MSVNTRVKISDTQTLIFEDRQQKTNSIYGGNRYVSQSRSNRVEVPEAKAAMDKFKTDVASELGVNLKEGYNGDLTSREAGSIGGEMVRRMVKSYEESIK